MSKSPFDDFFEAFKRGWNFRLPSISFHGGSGVRKGFGNPFVTVVERERRETKRLFDEVKVEFQRSRYADDEFVDKFIFDLVVESCETMGGVPCIPLGEALWAATRSFLSEEGSIFGFPKIDFSAELTIEEGVWLRNYLARKRRFLSDDARLLKLFRETLIRALGRATSSLPGSAFVDDGEDVRRTGEADGVLSAPLIDLCDNPAQTIEEAATVLFAEDVRLARLFDDVRERIDRNIFAASSIPWEKRHESSKALVFPTKARGLSNAQLVETYVSGTGFTDLFKARLPFSIPLPARFEHTVIVGGSGHGKTQLMQLLIHHDLVQSAEDGRSVIVIDSQGDLIRTISHLAYFGDESEQNLADRFVLIDPNDVEHPVCLNMFDWNRERLSSYAAVDREKILNGTIEMYEYLFGALLGAELTQRQGLIFKYIARLMMEIPDATVHTLRELMENGEPFRKYAAKLPGTARSFFETRFFDRSFNETKKQILTRLWGVLSNATLERMFSHPRNKVDIYGAMNSGKIVLINTAKELLKQEGCAIFGRFFIGLIAQATVERAALPPHKRRPVFFYIDEAADYFDQNIENLLNQARKYRVGMVFAHQNLDQLSQGLRSSVLSNTTIKFAGGVSAKDAGTFASEMRCEPDFVHRMQKRASLTEFACFVKNLTPAAIQVTAPLGFVEQLPLLSDESYDALVAENRERYCTTLEDIERRLVREEKPKATPATEVPPLKPTREAVAQAATPQAPPREAAVTKVVPTKEATRGDTSTAERRERVVPPPPPLGRGGREHKYLQQFVKTAAHDRGFKATIEEPILDGAGRVDVSLVRDDRRIACEISVTTTREQELENIEKCLAAGYEHVILVSAQERHVATLQKFIVPRLEPDEAERVFFLTPDAVLVHLDTLVGTTAVTEETIRGYKVKVSKQALSPDEAAARRRAIAEVIAKSVAKAKEQK